MTQSRKIVLSLSFVGLAAATPVCAQQAVARERVARAESADELLARPVTIDVKGVTLKSAIDAAATNANVFIQYRVPALDAYTTPVTLRVTNVPLRVALGRLLDGTRLHVVADGTTQLVITDDGEVRKAVQTMVAGRVTDANTKQPLRGATVSLSGRSATVTTGDHGAFQFSNVPSGTHRVSVRLLGYVRATRTVTIMDGQTSAVEIALEPSVNALDQVIVTGTVVATAQREVPNAMTVITAKDIEQRGITRIDQLFRGDIPGLFAFNEGAGNPLDSVVMFSRGGTALSVTSSSSGLAFTNPIKTYVDGIEMAQSTYLSQIDPRSIERIEFVTGPQASTIYGSNAINGVMQVFTKRGTTPRPQLTATLLSGLVQNNFSANTPQHDYSAHVSGTESHLSYNAGGSWTYMGRWSPSSQRDNLSGFGGARLKRGMITADASLRLSRALNASRGNAFQGGAQYRTTGWWVPSAGGQGQAAPASQSLLSQTLGLTMSVAPVTWWSHELAIGQDQSASEARVTGRGYLTPTDTLLTLSVYNPRKTSIRYATTTSIPMSSMARAVIVLGADAWEGFRTLTATSTSTLTGTLAGTTTVNRRPSRNAGGFIQGQLGVLEQLFLTYGLRAEWNPDFGDAQPNLSPRYGAAYTRDMGPLTSKLRASYGRATRPPNPQARTGFTYLTAESQSLLTQLQAQNNLAVYGSVEWYQANPDVTPEVQQGWEGGMELYWERRGSLVITRYNQTVDALLVDYPTDSIRSLAPNTSGVYSYFKLNSYLNLASIRNQGWELQGTFHVGPLTARSTYSWTKSRVIGVAPQYRALVTGSVYQPGASFRGLPEHTWSQAFTYAYRRTSITMNVTGKGKSRNVGVLSSDIYGERISSSVRLQSDRWIINPSFASNITDFSPGYALADLNATRQFSSRLEGILQVRNVTDSYRNERGANVAGGVAVLGRQTKVGARVRL